MARKKRVRQAQTCAGLPISAAMHMFSDDFLRGCNDFAKKAKRARRYADVRTYNTACIIFAVSAIEAKVNEWVSIAQICFINKPKSFWHVLTPMMKTLKLDEKWNLIASYRNATLWDSGRDPFQSYELISSLRNELVHYKGQLLTKDTPPNKKIKGLMDMLGVKSKSSFIEDDCSAWVYDLLNSRELGRWVAKKISYFDCNLMRLLNGII